MNEVLALSLSELSERIDRGDLSSRDIVEAFLGRIDEVDDRVRAMVRTHREPALREASAADDARRKGNAKGPLHGLPIVLKDNLVSPDFETHCGSRILQGFRAPYEATVVTKLKAAGMIVLGNTNMDEFAMGSSTENSSLHPTSNPWDLGRVPGGSSGGSAAAVAAREAPAALGSDTGGSIRQPASLCGIAGMKPTYGRVSRYGLVAFASSLDQIGPMGNRVSDLALLLEVIAGHDAKDSTSLEKEVPHYKGALDGSVDDLRIGVPRKLFETPGADPRTLALVREAIEELERAGAKTVDVELPHSAYGIAAYYLICTAEASSNLSRYDGVKFGYRAEAETLDEMYRRTRSEGFGREVKRRILLGTYVLSAGYYDAYYRKAQRIRTLVREDFRRAFEGCDVIAMPTAPGPAWPLGERVEDPLQMYLQDTFTVTANLAGLPALSVPCGFVEDRWPAGLHLITRPLDESTLLRVGDAYERRTEWHQRMPSLSA